MRKREYLSVIVKQFCLAYYVFDNCIILQLVIKVYILYKLIIVY